MTTQTDDLAALVLELPAGERARLLELLLASIEPQSNAQDWMALAQQRRADVDGDKVAMVRGADSLARVRARLE